jgi:hypothetical protein
MRFSEAWLREKIASDPDVEFELAYNWRKPQ